MSTKITSCEIKDNNEIVEVHIYYHRYDGGYHFFGTNPNYANKYAAWAFVKSVKIPIETLEVGENIIFPFSGEKKFIGDLR